MMNETFDLLLPRIIDCNNKVDYEKMISSLRQIKDTCICIGTGGSNIVSAYAKDVISESNDVLTMNMEPRTFLYTNVSKCNSACLFSYGGYNYGVDEVLRKTLQEKMNSIVFTSDNGHLEKLNPNVIINYQGAIDKEVSFISIASTFMPMSLLLRYYLHDKRILFEELMSELYIESNHYINQLELDLCNNDIDIMTGDNTYVASSALESTLVEAGLARPLMHEKYSYCHGRTTLPFYHKPALLIYFINGRAREIDNLLLDNIKSLYNQVVVIKSNYEDKLIGSFDLTLKAMLLAKKIALELGKDLSKVDYAPQVKKLYRFKGEM